MAVKPLPRSYYRQDDVVALAKDLLGKVLLTSFAGEITAGIIIETEAYRAPEDRASHAYGNRKTARNRVMFEEGGHCYIYRCYGIHNLFNVVTNQAGIPHAILVRALKPKVGIETMIRRRGITDLKRLCQGPGALTVALGLTNLHNGLSLLEPPIWIEEGSNPLSLENMIASSRIGVDYAGEDARLPWRFRLIQ